MPGLVRAGWLAAVALAASAAAQEPARPRIVYGGDAGAAPYESLDATLGPQGFNVELIRALGKRASIDVEFRFSAWPQPLRELEAGDVDLVSIAFTDERAQKYDFLGEIWTLRQAIFFPAARASPPARVDQLGSETIAVPEGLYMHDLLGALPDAQRPLLRPVTSPAQQLELLRKGEVTAVAGNALLLGIAAANAGMRGLHELPVKALSAQLATRKGRGGSFNWVGPALRELRSSGEHTRLVERYLSASPATRRSWREYLLAASLLLGLAGLGLSAAWAWNRSLRSQVQLRTQELKSSLSLLQSALESTADGLLVVNHSGRVSTFNDRFAQMWRVPKSLLESGDDAAVLAYVLDQMKDAEGFLARVGELYADPTRESSDVLEFADGRVFERYSMPQRLDGETVGRAWSFRDVTARRAVEREQAQLQDAIAQSAFQWRATFDAVDAPILILDREGRVRRLNRATRDLADKSYSELKGMPASRIGDGPLWRELHDAAMRAARDGGPVSVHVNDSAAGRTWDVSANPLADSGSTDGDVIVLARDVSRIVELQESLRRSATMAEMGSLVAGVAHEVRNPLFNISSTLDAFETRLPKGTEANRTLDTLRKEIRRLNALMAQLLDYARPPALSLQHGSVTDALQEAVAHSETLAETAQVRLTFEAAGELPPVQMDRERLVQAFQNLIQNALQHSPKGAQVVVRAEETRAHGARFVACSVRDSGPGFQLEDLSHVFEPFFTRRRGGTGLGLSLVHRIVEQHGAKVVAENHPAGGALLTICLPVGDQP